MVQDKKTPSDDSDDDSGDAKVSKALNEKPSDDHLRKQEPGLLKKEPGLLKLEEPGMRRRGPGGNRALSPTLSVLRAPRPWRLGCGASTPSSSAPAPLTASLPLCSSAGRRPRGA